MVSEQRKQLWMNVITSLIEGTPEQGDASTKELIRTASQSVFFGESVEEDEDAKDDKKKSDDEESKDDDEESKDDKKKKKSEEDCEM